MAAKELVSVAVVSKFEAAENRHDFGVRDDGDCVDVEASCSNANQRLPVRVERMGVEQMGWSERVDLGREMVTPNGERTIWVRRDFRLCGPRNYEAMVVRHPNEILCSSCCRSSV